MESCIEYRYLRNVAHQVFYCINTGQIRRIMQRCYIYTLYNFC